MYVWRIFRPMASSFSCVLFCFEISLNKSFIIFTANSMQYGQNNLLPYAQQQNDHNNMFGNDHKDNILKAKMERERDEGKCHALNSATLAPSQLAYTFNQYSLQLQQSISKFCKMLISHGKRWPIPAIPLIIHRICCRPLCPFLFNTSSNIPKPSKRKRQ